MERPLLTVIQYHLSVNETEIRALTEGPEDAQWSHGSGRGAHPRVPGFQELVVSLAQPIPEHADTVTKDTVVLFNTGAHVGCALFGPDLATDRCSSGLVVLWGTSSLDQTRRRSMLCYIGPINAWSVSAHPAILYIR